MADLSEATYRVAGGYDIHLKEAGSGPAVVFLHGGGRGTSGASNFRLNIDAFVAAGYPVILPDLIGYGASSKTRRGSITRCGCSPTPSPTRCTSTGSARPISSAIRWAAGSPSE